MCFHPDVAFKVSYFGQVNIIYLVLNQPIFLFYLDQMLTITQIHVVESIDQPVPCPSENSIWRELFWELEDSLTLKVDHFEEVPLKIQVLFQDSLNNAYSKTP